MDKKHYRESNCPHWRPNIKVEAIFTSRKRDWPIISVLRTSLINKITKRLQPGLKSVALYAVGHGSGDIGGFHRNSSIGGSAYGIPRNTLNPLTSYFDYPTSISTSPTTKPSLVGISTKMPSLLQNIKHNNKIMRDIVLATCRQPVGFATHQRTQQ